MDISTIIIYPAIAVIGGIIAGKYLFSSNRVSKLEAEKAAIEAGRLELKHQVMELIKEKSELENIVAELQKKVSKYESKDLILIKYEFSNTWGTWEHKSSKQLICTICVNKMPPIEQPLQCKTEHDCQCPECDESYQNNEYYRNRKLNLGQNPIHRSDNI